MFEPPLKDQIIENIPFPTCGKEKSYLGSDTPTTSVKLTGSFQRPKAHSHSLFANTTRPKTLPTAGYQLVAFDTSFATCEATSANTADVCALLSLGYV